MQTLWILGIWDGHDAGACLLEGPHVRAAISEERLSRKKRAAGFPYLSIQACLEAASTDPQDIAIVAYAGRSGRAPFRLLDSRYRQETPSQDLFGWRSRLVYRYENLVSQMPGARHLDALVSQWEIQDKLRCLGIRKARLFPVPHHEAHAYAAYRTSGFSDVLVLTLDGYGEGLSGTVSVPDPERGRLLRLVRKLGYLQSVSVFYGLVNQLLGFEEGDEGKVMGLAGKGSANGALREFEKSFWFDGTTIRTAAQASRRDWRWARRFSPEDLAAAVQAHVERTVTTFAQSLLAGMPSFSPALAKPACWSAPDRGTPLACAGGLFANIRVNQLLSELPGIEQFYVFPHMGDGGLALGAAVRAWASTIDRIDCTEPLPHVFWGPPCSEDQESKKGGRPHDPVGELVERLERGEVIGICRGPEEFGPRALGNRSILFSAASRDLGEHVSRVLSRPDFMPFAPAVRAEDEEECFQARPSAAWARRFMTITANTTEKFRRLCPGAVHIDGTARPQVVDRDTHPFLHELLARYKERTGQPALINTSFNLHGDPIVHSEDDALETAYRIGLDTLLVGNRLVATRKGTGRKIHRR